MTNGIGKTKKLDRGSLIAIAIICAVYVLAFVL